MMTHQLHRLNVNLLVALDALLELRHVTHAAERVGLTQSAMSRNLGQLRALLGDPLLVRAGRQMVLTPFAAQLGPGLRHALVALERTVFVPPAFDPATATRRFRVMTADMVAAIAGPLLAPQLLRTQGISVRFERLQAHRAGAALEADELDVVIAGALTHGGLVRVPLYQDRFCVVMRADHPSAGGLDLDAYVHYPHVLVNPVAASDASTVGQALQREGRSRRVLMEVPDFLAAPFALRASDALWTAPERLALALAPGLGLTCVPVPLVLPPLRVHLWYHERMQADPGHLWLREVLHTALLAPSGVPEHEGGSA